MVITSTYVLRVTRLDLVLVTFACQEGSLGHSVDPLGIPSKQSVVEGKDAELLQTFPRKGDVNLTSPKLMGRLSMEFTYKEPCFERISAFYKL